MFNSLKFRMPLVVLGGVLPLMLVAIYIASAHAAKTIRQEAKENLIIKTKTLAESVSRWEESNILAPGTLTEQPDIVGMNPEKQKAILDTIVNNYKHIYLAHTVDQNGWIIARSDEKKTGGYRADLIWFKNSMAGADLTRQLLISRTIEQPSLCLSAPIRTDKLNILGVTAICSDLQALTEQVGQLKFGETGYAFIVDESGSVLAHPDPKYLSGTKLKDVSYYPPVKHFLAGNTGDNIFNFFDEVNWISYQVPLNNGWGVI
ncbi:MAG: cache domain-containing protein, partial [Xenococcus sp. (in: cyanobacteria)]